MELLILLLLGVDVEGGGVRLVLVFWGLLDIYKWKKDDWMKKGVIVLRGLILIFLFIFFMVMVINIYGYGVDFNLYEEYK